MDKFSIWVEVKAKSGKEQEVEDFLKSALPLAEAEPGTTTWYALKMSPNTFGIFDTFADEEGRKAHLSGPIAKALFSKAEELLDGEPQVKQAEIKLGGPKACQSPNRSKPNKGKRLSLARYISLFAKIERQPQEKGKAPSRPI